MNRFTVSLRMTVIASLAIGLGGCNDGSRQVDSTSDKVSSAGSKHEGDKHSPSEMQRAEEGLAKLSPENAADAKRQKVCPVSGEMLGTMGAPVKVDVSGKSVWICCDACRDELFADPDKYLAKLKVG